MKAQNHTKDKASANLKFWLLYHLGLLGFSVIAAFIISYTQSNTIEFPEIYINIAIIFLISVTLGYLASFMVKKGSKLSHTELTKRMVPYFLSFSILSFIIANVIVSLGVLFHYIVSDVDLQHFLPNLFRNELPYASKSIVIWLMLFSILFFYVLWRKSASKEQALREEKLKYQYQTLKSQINPHFLFNSFSTLSELVYEDPEKADKYIQELSGIYRYVIEHEEKRLISLQAELDFVQKYFHLQKQRLNEKIKLNIRLSGTENFNIVPVSVQSIIENAIKHNIATRNEPLIIDVYIENDFLVVCNNLQKKNTLELTTQKGLRNINEQVKLILGNELQVVENHDAFIVKIPLSINK